MSAESSSGRGPRVPSKAARRRPFLIGLIAILAAALIAVIAIASARALAGGAQDLPEAIQTTIAPTPTPTPTPLTPAQQLLKDAPDPATACAVTFFSEGVELTLMLQTEGALYSGLPIPERAGAVFAGWYPTPETAQAQVQTDRVNGSQLAACVDHESTLYAAWTTPEQNLATAAKVPILMYHQFTTKPEGESGWLRGNFVYVEDFRAQMDYVAAQEFYLPTWDELDAFIDGRLFLPRHSLIITDDDADPTWLELAVPIVTERQLLTTSFVITSARQDATPSPFVLQRSHTSDMHRAGDDGKGRMVNLSADEVAADLEESARILGSKEVVAYPYGHHNPTAEQGVTQAGYVMARTIEHGYVRGRTSSSFPSSA
ncbi:xylanase [Microbacterium sp. NPDC089987]|uniref:xylanase n=1 Tax=Microbacterium sp. NPDC089987 TaxID=3364202 RepID=UPI0037FE2FAE